MTIETGTQTEAEASAGPGTTTEDPVEDQTSEATAGREATTVTTEITGGKTEVPAHGAERDGMKAAAPHRDGMTEGKKEERKEEKTGETNGEEKALEA